MGGWGYGSVGGWVLIPHTRIVHTDQKNYKHNILISRRVRRRPYACQPFRAGESGAAANANAALLSLPEGILKLAVQVASGADALCLPLHTYAWQAEKVRR